MIVLTQHLLLRPNSICTNKGRISLNLADQIESIVNILYYSYGITAAIWCMFHQENADINCICIPNTCRFFQ